MKSQHVLDDAPPAPRYAMVKLDDIRIDGGSQQRPLSQEALESYEERRLGGEDFPALQTVFDGLHHWLWDGFHRFHVARKVGDRMIMVEITEGTQRDAVWLSFGANKDHGMPRPKGCASEILRKILTDDEWKEVPQVKIAQHVGVSAMLVSKVRASINQFIDAPAKETGNESDNGSTRVVTRRGKTYQMRVGKIGKVKKPRMGRLAKDHFPALKLRGDVPDNVTRVRRDSVTIELSTNHIGNCAYALYHTFVWSYLEQVIKEIQTMKAQEQKGVAK